MLGIEPEDKISVGAKESLFRSHLTLGHMCNGLVSSFSLFES